MFRKILLTHLSRRSPLTRRVLEAPLLLRLQQRELRPEILPFVVVHRDPAHRSVADLLDDTTPEPLAEGGQLSAETTSLVDAIMSAQESDPEASPEFAAPSNRQTILSPVEYRDPPSAGESLFPEVADLTEGTSVALLSQQGTALPEPKQSPLHSASRNDHAIHSVALAASASAEDTFAPTSEAETSTAAEKPLTRTEPEPIQPPETPITALPGKHKAADPEPVLQEDGRPSAESLARSDEVSSKQGPQSEHSPPHALKRSVPASTLPPSASTLVVEEVRARPLSPEIKKALEARRAPKKKPVFHPPTLETRDWAELLSSAIARDIWSESPGGEPPGDPSHPTRTAGLPVPAGDRLTSADDHSEPHSPAEPRPAALPTVGDDTAPEEQPTPSSPHSSPLSNTGERLIAAVTGISPAAVPILRDAGAAELASARSADGLALQGSIILGAGHTTDEPRTLGLVAHELTHLVDPSSKSPESEARARSAEAAVIAHATQARSPSRPPPDSPARTIPGHDGLTHTSIQPRPQASPSRSAVPTGEASQQSAASPSAPPPWGDLPAPWEPLPTWGKATTQPVVGSDRMVPGTVSVAVPAAARVAARAPQGRLLPQPEPVQLPTPPPDQTDPVPPDLDELARQVYDILKRRLARERRRFPGD